MSVKQELRCLLASYSPKQVHVALLEIFKEDYEFLSSLYGSAPQAAKAHKRKASAVAAEPVVAAAEPVLAEESLKVTPGTKIRIVKKEELVPAGQEQEQDDQEEEEELAPEPKPSKFRSPKEVRNWQKENEEKKYAELMSQGIVPESLLTQENLKKWLEKDDRTYAYIARELVGVSEGVVSSTAQKFGLKSSVNKKRAMIAANKVKK
jgi:hypothetical protein